MKFLLSLTILLMPFLSYAEGLEISNRQPDSHTESAETVQANAEAAHPFASLQERLGNIETLNLVGKVNRNAGKISLNLIAGEKKSNESIANLDCKVDYSGRQGTRLACGGDPCVVEVVYTQGESDGAAVLYFRKNGDLGKKYYQCHIRSRRNELGGFSCSQVELEDVKDESKLKSPIKKTIPTVSVPNTHGVGPKLNGKFQILRGMQPKSDEDYKTLISPSGGNVNRVLIFKNPFKGDVGREIEEWENKYKIKAEKIEFPWKNFSNFQEPCSMTVEALKIMAESKQNGQTLFFHCTVGEDRTGFLAGMYRLLSEGGKAHDLFIEEMCERGYEKGDAQKPYENVDLEIRKALTRTYIQMAYKAEREELTQTGIENALKKGPDAIKQYTESVCKDTLSVEDIVKKDPKWNPENFKCKTSTRYRPR